MEGKETTYEKRNKKKKRMEVGRGWRGTRYTHTQHNNIPAIIRWPHVCHCCATLSVMRVHRVHRRRINEKRECRGLIRGVESTFNAMEETPDDPGALRLMKVKYKREREGTRRREAKVEKGNVRCPVFLCLPLVLASVHSAFPQIDTSTAVCIYLDVPAGRWEARYFKI